MSLNRVSTVLCIKIIYFQECKNKAYLKIAAVKGRLELISLLVPVYEVEVAIICSANIAIILHENNILTAVLLSCIVF